MKTVLLGLHPQKSYRESWKQSEKYHNYAWNLLPHTCTTCETTASYLMWFVQKLQPLEFACRASSPSSPFSKMPDRLLICCHFCSSPQRIQGIRRRKPFASSVKTLTTSMFLWFSFMAWNLHIHLLLHWFCGSVCQVRFRLLSLLSRSDLQCGRHHGVRAMWRQELCDLWPVPVLLLWRGILRLW